MARLANLVGDANVGSPKLMDTHRPDAIRMERFRLAQESAGGRRKNLSSAVNGNRTELRIAKPANGFRFFRPVMPARVELRDGLPGRIFFQGLRGEVVAASGPWRTSGDWWQEPWDQAEWDVEVQFSSTGYKKKFLKEPVRVRGLYLIYYDARQQGWFLRGAYD